jgi:hypothetical protein
MIALWSELRRTLRPGGAWDNIAGCGEASMKRLLTRENLLAIGLCLLVILLIIVTAESGPTFIYQGF